MADSGIGALDDMIARLRELAGPTVGSRVAAKAAPLVGAALKKTAAAGTTPDGRPWKPKLDGGRALVNAAAAIDAKASGNFVIATLSGPTVFHHLGLGHKPVRQVLPDSGTVPDGVRQAAVEAAAKVFREITGR